MFLLNFLFVPQSFWETFCRIEILKITINIICSDCIQHSATGFWQPNKNNVLFNIPLHVTNNFYKQSSRFFSKKVKSYLQMLPEE